MQGASSVLKRGILIKNVHLTADPSVMECRAEKIKDLALRIEFLKRA